MWGCSTLALLENGYKVVDIEKNEYCIEKACHLITNKGYSYSTSLNYPNEFDVVFIQADLFDELIINEITEDLFDIIICWDVGSYWSKEMIEYYVSKLLRYGLTVDQILENPESSYSEYIIWKTCKIAGEFSKPVHIIERLSSTLNESDKSYYDSLKIEFFSHIKYDYKETFTKSAGGRILNVNQKQCKDKRVEVVLASILYEI